MTELEVLSPVDMIRGATRMYHVRVRTTGATGSTFLGEDELSDACPFVWPDPGDTRPARSVDTREAGEDCIRRGSFPKLAATSAPGVTQQIELTRDLDGDGRADRAGTVTTEGGRACFVFVLDTAAGWQATCFGSDAGGDRHQIALDAPVIAGAATYLVVEDTVDWAGDRLADSEDRTSFDWYRVRSNGEIASVTAFTLTPTRRAQVQFTGEADGSVTLAVPSGRTQRLQWDGATFRLRPR